MSWGSFDGRQVAGAIIGVLILATTSAVLASTMAFKVTYPLVKADGGVTSSTGRNALSLPYQLKPGIVMALDLMNDIGFANVISVQRYNRLLDNFQTYTGRTGSPIPNFNLVPGEGYIVRMNANVTYRIVGFDDPTVAYQLKAADGDVTSHSGVNFFSVPYNCTAVTALDLMNDMGFANVASVGKYVKQNDSLQVFTGREGSPSPNFNLVRGEAYLVKMNSTISYIPTRF